MHDSYKQMKLNHVSNLNGTSLSDLTLTITMIPLINCLSYLLKILIICWRPDKFNDNSNSLTFDFITNIIPFCLILTLASEYMSLIQFSLTIIIFILFKLSTSTIRVHSTKITQKKIEHENEDIIEMTIGSFQSMIYMLTAICILAVDFKIFPRRFAKTETYGLSIMDLGVALYMICHAFKLVKYKFKDETIDELSRLPDNFMQTLKSCSILLGFGVIRLASIKFTGYVEHVSEYGVHWNFFFTIALVKLVGSLVQIYIKKSAWRAALIGIAILATYQNLLLNKNLANYLLYKLTSSQLQNATLIDMNKEGIYSCLGYLALYFFGESMAICLYSKTREKNSTNPYVPLFKCLLILLFICGTTYFLLQFSRVSFGNVSRRLCNASFIFLALMISSLLLALYLCTILFIVKLEERLQMNSSKRVFSLIQVLNSTNVGLVVFILSNILTGLVNLSTNTLEMSNLAAFATLCGYSFVIFYSSYAFFYRINNFKLK